MNNRPYIIGADECGYGCLAGEVVVAGIRAPKEWSIDGLNDSKKLSDKQRRIMNDKLKVLIDDNTIQASICSSGNILIDANGIYHELKTCYADVCKKLYDEYSHIIIDGNMKFDGFLDNMDYETIIKADTFIPAVMAASIIGKVYRDDIMINLHEQYKEYGWNTNMGYGSPKHIEAIKKLGYTEYHRRSYKIKGV